MSDTEKSAQAQPNESVEPSFRYNAKLAQGIEEKWQKIWDDEGTFWAANVNGDLKDGKGHNAEGRPSYFAMDMFPYPSGKGLHVGHPLGYLATDVVSRYHRMKGENVLHAMGYDAFGLPAEQYAVQTGQHPRITTEQNIANMRRQLHRMGLSFDNRRSFATIDPGYVRWTQWIFSRIYDAWYDKDATNPSGSKGCARPISTLVEQFESGKRAIPGFEGKAWADLSEAEQADVLNDFRLAYISKSPVNWCPGLGTVLANEEVTAEGKSERGNFPVFQRELRQWSMRITAYGHRLIEDLDTIDWPEKVKLMQRNWIGESHGASVHFDVETPNGVKDMEIYTTRPDTLFGTTFAVVSPEHHLLENVPAEWPAETPEDWKGGYATPVEAVKAYRLAAEAKTAKDRVDEAGEKTGLFTGLYAINPITGAKLPLFTADYVLMDYGTGAIMAVPGGDQRDYDFAVKFGLPVIYTVKPLPESGDDLANYEGKAPFVSHDGIVINSSIDATKAKGDSLSLDGLRVDIRRLLAHLKAHGQLRVVHVDDRVGKRLGELAADILRQLDARHGKALVRALGLHLEAVRRRHRVVQVRLGKRRDGVLVLLAGGRARDRCNAEHLAHGVIRRVEVSRVVGGLDVQRRLQICHAEVADGFEPALDVCDQPLFKIVLVEALEKNFSGLTEQQIIHSGFVPFLSGYHRQRSTSVMNMPIDHAPSHTSSRHTSTPRMSPMSEQT